MAKKTLTTFEVSRICHVNPTTVSRWVDDGKLEGFRTPGGHRRITRDAFLRFLRRNNLPFGLEGLQERKRILLACDRRQDLAEVEGVLRRQEGYEVERAGSGVEAILKLERYRPDLLLLDFALPDLDVLAVVRNLKSDERFRSIPILALGPPSARRAGQKARSYGLDDFIAAPVRAEEILRKIRALLA